MRSIWPVSTQPLDSDTFAVIMHSRKSLLFSKENVLVKNDNPSFDVTMGSYDGAEVCELVGLYILDRIKVECPEIELGLYRDDGLGITKNLSGRDTENLRKKTVPDLQILQPENHSRR